jgi:MoxR-like ATPase
MHRVITAEDALLRRMLDIGVVTPPDHTVKARRVVDGIYIDDKIRDYIVDLTFATREPGVFDVAIAGRIQYGASPRRT